MEHVIVIPEGSRGEMLRWLNTTLDGSIFDLDVLAHKSTFVLNARSSDSGSMAYLPVQQPLMLENLIFRQGLSERQRALSMTRMAEAAISEAFKRDAGEVYFLCRDTSTCDFAERHKFKSLESIDPLLKVYRLNLLETFGS